MKRFFKDVFGELRNPSEDAGQVLAIMKRLICAVMLISAILYIFGFVFSIINFISMYKENVEAYQLGIEHFGIFSSISSYIKLAVDSIIFFVLFLAFNISIRKNTNVNSVLLIMSLSILYLIPIVFSLIRIFTFENVYLNLLSSIKPLGIYLIIAVVFFRIKNSEENEQKEKARIRNAFVISFVLFLFLSIMTIVRYFIGFSYHVEYWKTIFTYIAEYKGLKYLYFLLGTLITDISFLYYVAVFTILILILINKLKYFEKIKKFINVLWYFAFALNILLVLYSFSIINVSILLVFLLAAGYKNKYRVFDNLATRLAKTGIQKFKAWFQRYMSFEEK
ncbi:MAG: hypothetical protein AB1Z23_02865 [Eubacteriales bacterium]